METALFYILSALTLALGLLVITRRNPVTSALLLVLAFFCLAGIYVLLDAFFLAAVQVAVYAGAIMVLFLFVIMMLDLGLDSLKAFMTRRVKWLAAGSALLMSIIMILLVARGRALSGADPGQAGEAAALAERIFGAFLLPFELVAVLLLAAIVGAVVMARREE